MAEDNLENLKQDILNKKQMVLFLGAGINNSHGKNLLWKDVISEFLKEALPLLDMPQKDIETLKKALDTDDKNNKNKQLKDINEFSTEIKIAVVKRLLGDRYIPLLRDIIYSQCNYEELEKACNKYVDISCYKKSFHSLFSTAEMILRNENIKAVVTYNYDNFLSEAIKLLQKKKDYFISDVKRTDNEKFYPIDVYSGWMEEPFIDSSFLIYHVHGYIQPPEGLNPNERNKIVMSLDEYYDSAKDSYSWQTATQLHFLTHYTCLYIGASLLDMTMQRTLQYANLENNSENVYYLTQKGDALRRLKNLYHTANYLKVIEVDNFSQFYQEINNINVKQSK